MDLLRRYVRNQWDRVGAWVCIGVGALALVVGWLGVSGTPYSAEQTPYLISGGLGGVFLLGLGAMLWLSADLTDEWRKLDAMEQRCLPPSEQPSAGSRGEGNGGRKEPESAELPEVNFDGVALEVGSPGQVGRR